MSVFYIKNTNGKDIHAAATRQEADEFIANDTSAATWENVVIEVEQPLDGYPAMVNDQSKGKPEPTPELKLRYEYHVQVQYGNAGWEKPREQHQVPFVLFAPVDANNTARLLAEETKRPTRVKIVAFMA